MANFILNTIEYLKDLKPFRQWLILLKNRKFVISLISGFILMFIALYLNLVALRFTEDLTSISTSVRDLILDKIPTVNLNFIYTVGIFIIISIIIIYPLIFKPEIVPFALKTFAFFVIIRSFFITLTHLGPPDGFSAFVGPPPDHLLKHFFHLNDLFFSAHTGIPFLAFLIFRENKILSIFFLLASFVMAITVLFMHLHYSIDVFGAYFITYSIFVLSERIFKNLNSSFRKIIRELEEERAKIKKFFTGKKLVRKK